MTDIIHLTCGQVAFRYDHRPAHGEIISARSAVLLDGTQPLPHSYLFCGSCGEQVMERELRVANWPRPAEPWEGS